MFRFKKIGWIVFSVTIFSVALILGCIYGYKKYQDKLYSDFISKNVSSSNSWHEYVPKCKALKDNLKIYLPDSWKISEEFPVYDGGNPLRGQAEKDFRNLVSHCQILIGFGVKPESYQDSHQGDYGVIYVSAQNISVPGSLKVGNWYDIYGDQSWSTISNRHYEVDVSLEINLPDYNSKELNEYMNKTFTELQRRLIIK